MYPSKSITIQTSQTLTKMKFILITLLVEFAISNASAQNIYYKGFEIGEISWNVKNDIPIGTWILSKWSLSAHVNSRKLLTLSKIKLKYLNQKRSPRFRRVPMVRMSLRLSLGWFIITLTANSEESKRSWSPRSPTLPQARKTNLQKVKSYF